MANVFSRALSALGFGPPPLEPTDIGEERADLIARAVDAGNMIQSGLYRNTHGPRKGSDEIIALYRESPWLRAVAHKVGQGVARTEWKLYARRAPGTTKADPRYVIDEEIALLPHEERKAKIARGLADGEVDEIIAHPALRVLNRPNMTMSGFAARLVTSVHMDLIGESFWVVDVNGEGMPVRLWPIPPTWITSTPSEREPFFRMRFADFTGVVPMDRMIWFRDIDPGEPYGRGAGLGLALADELDIDEHAAKTVAAWFQNNAMPSMLVGLKGASDAVVQRARIKWDKALKGFRKNYQTYFTGAEIKVEKLDTSFKDMALVDIRKAERDTILSVWGMPPEKLAVLTSSNRSTIEAADLIFTKDVVLPRLELFRQEFQWKLIPRFDPRLIVDFVDPVPANVEAKITLSGQRPIFSVDEQRKFVGEGPVGDARGFLVPRGEIFVDKLEDLKTSGKPVFAYHLASGLLTNNEARAFVGLPPTSEPWGDERTVGYYMGEMPTGGGEDPFDGGGGTPPDEGGNPGGFPGEAIAKLVTKRAATQRSGRQPDVRLDAPPVVAKAWLTVGQVRRLINSIKASDVGDSVEPVVEEMVEAWGDETIQAIDQSLSFDVDAPDVDSFFKAYTEQRVGELVNETTRDEVKSTIESWDGEDPEELVQGVRGVFERARVVRSQAIATTEGTHTSQFAAREAMRQSGIVEEKEWIAAMDGRTREAHQDLDGQMRDVDAPFEVPRGPHSGAQAQFPGAFGIAALDCNCRCFSAPIVTVEGADDEIDDTPSTADTSRYTRGCVLPRGAPHEIRAAVWKAADTKLRKWEARLSDAYAEGFEKQETKTLDMLRDMIGD